MVTVMSCIKLYLGGVRKRDQGLRFTLGTCIVYCSICYVYMIKSYRKFLEMILIVVPKINVPDTFSFLRKISYI